MKTIITFHHSGVMMSKMAQKRPQSLVEPHVMEGRARLQATPAGLGWELQTQKQRQPSAVMGGTLSVGSPLSWLESGGCRRSLSASPIMSAWDSRDERPHALHSSSHRSLCKARSPPSPGPSYTKGSAQTFLGLPARSSS